MATMVSSDQAAKAQGPLAVPAVGIWAGVLIAALTAGAAFQLHELPGLAMFSPMIVAVVIGIAYANIVGAPAHAKVGIVFCQKTLLRFAIVLLGFQLTLGQLSVIGISGAAIIVAVLLATFVCTLGLGRLLGVERNLTCLIAAGTSICGASAIVATNAVIQAKEEDVAYSVACITLFGTIAMLGFPLLAPVLELNQQSFGIWAGASIHEVAQVVGAAFQNSQQAGEIATVAKLTRVVMLAPMVIALGLFVSRRASSRSDAPGVSVPWFALWFVAAMVFNSVVEIPQGIRNVLVITTTILLSIGLAALGLQTNVAAIRRQGVKPLLLAFFAFVFIASISLALLKMTA
ncbi:MAG: YeiH family protein [Rhizobiaceae bacterium]|nr:YeiH family protein [Rhizobiaceae bacterium]